MCTVSPNTALAGRFLFVHEGNWSNTSTWLLFDKFQDEGCLGALEDGKILNISYRNAVHISLICDNSVTTQNL
jgi:hypothetical protein